MTTRTTEFGAARPAAAALALAALLSACAGQRLEPAPGPAAAHPAAPNDAVPPPDASVDPAAVAEAQAETEAALEELDESARREFLALFGTDPLGLAANPENAVQYEIPLEMNEDVERWLDYYQNTIPERFALYLSRLGRWEGMIRPKLQAAGLPEDLIYLAMIESGMNPNAYSRAHAVGMWQFIRGTGRLYGLEVSYWLDERRDPIQATDAAIAHLKDLYDELGSWYLAAAAYNGGLGRVRRGIARTGSNDFWDLADARVLRAETRNYVPKLIAAALIGKNPVAHGFAGVETEPPFEYEEVEVPDATSFDVLAEAAGVDEATIRTLNPQFLRGVTPPGRAVSLRVPPGRSAAFAANYAAIPPSERVTWLVHTVTRGQTLGHIAGRYGTTVEAIRAANGNVNPRRLQIGQKLVVPRAGGRGLATASLAAAEEPSSRAVQAPGGPTTVTVRRGDTLWTIARRHNVTTSQLMSWNGLTSTVIRPGDRLRIDG